MKLTLRFFAGLRERLGCAERVIDVPQSVRTVADLRAHLAEQGGEWAALLMQKNLRSALDQTLVPPAAEASTPLHESAEVAFFPPVTGG
jgi:sulfur-carrier protein